MKIAKLITCLHGFFYILAGLYNSAGLAEPYKVVMPKDRFLRDMPILDFGAYRIGVYRMRRHRMLRRECIFSDLPN